MIRSILNQFKPFLYFARHYRLQSIFIVISFILAGFAEALSLVTLFPMLNLTMSNQINPNEKFAGIILKILDFLHLSPTLVSLLIVFVCLAVTKALLMFFSMFWVGKISARISTDLRKKLIESFLGANWIFYLKQKSGNFSAAITIDTERAASVFILAGRFVSEFVQMMAYLYIAFYSSKSVTLVAVGLSAVLFILLKRFITIARIAGENQTRTQKSLMSNLQEGFASFKAIKTMSLEKSMLKSFNQDLDNLQSVSIQKAFSKESLNNIQEPVYIIFIALGVYFAVTYKWFVSTEAMMVVVLLFYKSVQQIGGLQKNYQNIVQATPAFFFVDEMMKESVASKEMLHTGDKIDFKSKIVFENVSFSYGEKRVLNNISFEIPAHSLVALYGKSGSGKTTTIDLLAGLLEPNEGQIKIDNLPLKQIDLAFWRKQIGYVPQETFLFNDSIKNNLTFRENTYSDDEIIEALKKAGAYEFVASLPEGIYANVGERGNRFSGGQRQRLSIARALLRKPKLLLLDEATSALDPATEQSILATLKALSKEICILAISHQPAIKEASDIVFETQQGVFTRIK